MYLPTSEALRFHFDQHHGSDLSVDNTFISFICPECTKTNNSEQIVGHDSKATQDALITARINYKPNENNRNTIKTQH